MSNPNRGQGAEYRRQLRADGIDIPTGYTVLAREAAGDRLTRADRLAGKTGATGMVYAPPPNAGHSPIDRRAVTLDRAASTFLYRNRKVKGRTTGKGFAGRDNRPGHSKRDERAVVGNVTRSPGSNETIRNRGTGGTLQRGGHGATATGALMASNPAGSWNNGR